MLWYIVGHSVYWRSRCVERRHVWDPGEELADEEWMMGWVHSIA